MPQGPEDAPQDDSAIRSLSLDELLKRANSTKDAAVKAEIFDLISERYDRGLDDELLDEAWLDLFKESEE